MNENESKPLIIRIDDYLCHVNIMDASNDGQLQIEYSVMTIGGTEVTDYDHDYIIDKLSNFFNDALSDYVNHKQ